MTFLCLVGLNSAMLIVASYADALWACHAIFIVPRTSAEVNVVFVGEECVTSPKNVCVEGYAHCGHCNSQFY